MHKRILIDCGHQLNGDVGARGIVVESEITHTWGQELAFWINKYGGDVYVLKDGSDHLDDVYAPVREANAYVKPWLFISIHANACGCNARGAEIFVHPSVWNERATSDLAHGVLNAYMSVGAKYGVINRGVKSQDFYVLRETKNIAVLLELMFVDNKEDANLLIDRQFRVEACQAMAKALMIQAGQPIKE